jgi:hypothetical protein
LIVESDFFAGEIAKLFDSPTYSVADEILVNKLRDLRRRLVVAPQSVGAELSQHCTADHAALMRHFERVECELMHTSIHLANFGIKKELFSFFFLPCVKPN